MGRRARRRGGTATGRPTGEERAERVRASLEPLAPGERPGAVTVAAIIAALLALANLTLVAVGYELREGGGGPVGGILFAAILLAAAWGMWRARYWAVLGFQALLAITMLFAFASLTVAGNAWAVLLSASVLLGSGWLFYKLVRALARLQMPDRRPGAPVR